ncbi:hypothetical protein [Aquimarina algiphila]|uniref:hypothetical protein n=1 Tax=Aquimarina algiphila TaxID=2047982 RepID=UPI002490942F|nr:hypothetical protein [Aquimarina algiphila]
MEVGSENILYHTPDLDFIFSNFRPQTLNNKLTFWNPQSRKMKLAGINIVPGKHKTWGNS